MDPRQQVRCRLALALDEGDAVPIPGLLESVIAHPAICVDEAPGGDRLPDESLQTVSRRIGDLAHPDAAQVPRRTDLLNCHGNQHLIELAPAHVAGFRCAPAGSRPPRRGPSTGPGPAGPWRGGACAATSTPSCSSPSPGLAAALGRSLHSWLVTHHMARNARRQRWVRVSWKIVPAVTEVWWAQPAHCHHRSRTRQAVFVPSQRGHRNLPPTTGAAPDSPDTLAGSRIGARIRPDFAG